MRNLCTEASMNAPRARWRRLGLLAAFVMLWGACGDSGRISVAEINRIESVYLEGLSSSSVTMRADTVRAIGLTDSEQWAPMFQKALADKSPMVRGAAAVQLMRMGSEKAQGQIVSVLTGGDERAATVIAHEVFSTRSAKAAPADLLSVALRSDVVEVRRRAMRFGLLRPLGLLKGGDKRAASALLARLANLSEDPDPRVAGTALAALVRADRTDLLKEMVRDAGNADDIDDRRRAIRVLAVARLPKTRRALKGMSEAGPDELRREALIALMAQGREVDLDPVRKMLSGADEDTTIHIITALGFSGLTDALRIMRPYREDSRAAVRMATYESMGRHDGAEAVDFKRGLTDEDAGAAIAAVTGMVRADPNSVALSVRAALKNPARAGRVLQVLISAALHFELDGEMKLLSRLETQLRNVEETLKPLLQSESEVARAAAAELIFRRPDPMGLYKTLKEPSVEVTYALLDSLARSPGAEAPLAHLAFFESFNDAPMLSLRIISATGIWNAYRVSEELSRVSQ